MEVLGFPLTAEATLQNLTLDVLKSSEIEGEILDREQVRLSIARRLELDIGALAPVDRHVEGIVDRMAGCHAKSRAITNTEETLGGVLYKAHFWQMHKDALFNDRQRLMLNKVLDVFEGKLTTSKWAKITQCSQDTALRDILALVEQGVLEKDPGGGRSTSYSLKSLPGAARIARIVG
ncbi:MAG: DUF4172 domain-containing protein [Nitrosomonas sp.]|nr:DUF4172 domain-containing protein [Nitrosomonas sp.]